MGQSPIWYKGTGLMPMVEMEEVTVFGKMKNKHRKWGMGTMEIKKAYRICYSMILKRMRNCSLSGYQIKNLNKRMYRIPSNPNTKIRPFTKSAPKK